MNKDYINEYMTNNINTINSINSNLIALNNIVGVEYEGQELTEDQMNELLVNKVNEIYNTLIQFKQDIDSINNYNVNLNTIFKETSDIYETITLDTSNTSDAGMYVDYNDTKVDETNICRAVYKDIDVRFPTTENSKYIYIPISTSNIGDFYNIAGSYAYGTTAYFIIKSKFTLNGSTQVPVIQLYSDNPNVEDYAKIIYKSPIKSTIGTSGYSYNINITADYFSESLEDDECYFIIVNSITRNPVIKKRIGVNYDVNDTFIKRIYYNKLYGKRIMWFGDSFIYNAFALASLGTILSDNYNITSYNNSIADAVTITNNGNEDQYIYTPRFTTASSPTKDNNIYQRIIYECNSSTYNPQYIIIQGYVNDILQEVNLCRSSNATITKESEYTDISSLSSTYFEEALEIAIRKLKEKWKTAKIGFIIPPKFVNTGKLANQYQFTSVINSLCVRHSIPVLDLSKTGIIDPNLSIYMGISAGSAYYSKETLESTSGDGIHFTKLGYDTFIIDKIISWLLTL